MTYGYVVSVSRVRRQPWQLGRQQRKPRPRPKRHLVPSGCEDCQEHCMVVSLIANRFLVARCLVKVCVTPYGTVWTLLIHQIWSAWSHTNHVSIGQGKKAAPRNETRRNRKLQKKTTNSTSCPSQRHIITQLKLWHLPPWEVKISDWSLEDKSNELSFANMCHTSHIDQWRLSGGGASDSTCLGGGSVPPRCHQTIGIQTWLGTHTVILDGE